MTRRERERKLGTLLLLSYRCIATINVMWLFLMVPLVGLKCLIVEIPDHTHFIIFFIENLENVGSRIELEELRNKTKIRNRYNQIPHLTQDTL